MHTLPRTPFKPRKPLNPRTPTPLSTLSTLFALTLAATLPGCGGGDDVAATPAPAPVAPTPVAPAPAVSTTVTGSVVKGPVSGAAVCAYSVVASGRGSALGSCTTSDALGRYSFAVPAGSGPLWVEATGGTYTDEATGGSATLPPGSPLRSLTTATGGTVSSTLTPLTTLALNDALARLAGSGTLDGAAFAAAAVRLLATFGLPADLAIATATPTFGAGIDSYGTALTVISRMVAAGTPLATLLATVDPAALAAAYTAAAAPTPPAPTPPPPPPPPSAGGTPSASGTLTVGGVTAAGAATSLTPRADGFEVALKSNGSASYRFFSAPQSSPTQVDVTVTVSSTGAISAAYFDVATRTSGFCATNCGITVTAASGATRPVTVAFANTPMGGALRLNGSLVGDAPGAAWTVADLPGATTSALTVSGASVRALTSVDSTFDAGGGNTIRSIVLSLSDGSSLALSQSGSAAFTVIRVVPPATSSTCGTACNITVTDGTGTRVSFANTPLSGGVVINGTVDFARTSGSLSTNDTGGFTPVTSNIESLNNSRTLTFNVLGTAASAGLSLVTVEVLDGRVVRAQATVGIATQVLSCFDNGAVIGVPDCTGVTVGSDGRTVTFSNAVLRGGAVGTAARNVTFNGTVVAKGP